MAASCGNQGAGFTGVLLHHYNFEKTVERRNGRIPKDHMQGRQSSFLSRPGVAEAGAAAGSISPSYAPVMLEAELMAGSVAGAGGKQAPRRNGKVGQDLTVHGGSCSRTETATRQLNSAPLGPRDTLPAIFIGSCCPALDPDWTANRPPRQASHERALSVV